MAYVNRGTDEEEGRLLRASDLIEVPKVMKFFITML